MLCGKLEKRNKIREKKAFFEKQEENLKGSQVSQI